MSSSMDTNPNWLQEPPLLSRDPRVISNYTKQNDLVSQSQARFFRFIGTEESLIAPGPSSLLPQPDALYLRYQSNPSSVPNLPNHRSQFYESEDLSFPTDPNNADTLHAASTQYSNPASWRGTNRQMGQTEIENHNPLSSHQDVYGGSGVSAALESSYTIDASSSLPADSYPKSGAQDDHADATLLFPGQVEGVAPNLVEIQGQEASLQRERKFIEKRERDKARKKIERRKDADDYARICEVLDISLTPRSTLAHRILVGVEAMAERLKLDSDLRQRFEDTEAYLHFLTTTMGKLPSPDQVPTGTDTAATLRS